MWDNIPHLSFEGMTQKQRDNNLLSRIKSDPQEFIELYDQYYFEVLNFMYFRTNHRQTAEDLTSEVFRKAFENVLKIRKLKSPFYAWIYTIARNTLYSHYRKKKLHTLEHEEQIEDDRSGVLEEILNEEDQSERQLSADEMRKAIADLPQKYHEVLTLFYYEEYSVKDISERVGISNSAVKTRLNRARNMLKERI